MGTLERYYWEVLTCADMTGGAIRVRVRVLYNLLKHDLINIYDIDPFRHRERFPSRQMRGNGGNGW